MTKEEQKNRIRNFLANHIGNVEFLDDENLFGQGLINSLFAMELVHFVETEFNFTLANEDLKLANFKSVNAISELVGKQNV